MKLKYHFESVAVGDSLQMIPVGCDSFNGVITVNDTMKDIMELLEEERTEEEIVSSMLELYYGVTWEELTLAVQQVCTDLRKEGLLVG